MKNESTSPISINGLLKLKGQNRKIVELTAYDHPFAKIIDETKSVDIILVGDSLGMVVQGNRNTIKVSMDDILYHTKLVTRATNHSLVIADMPFMSFQVSLDLTLKNAGKLIQDGGAGGVKIEGAGKRVEYVRELVDIGIPVQGHLGLTPQSYLKLGWKVQAKTKDTVERLIEDAKKLEEAGAFSVVLEAVPVEAAKRVTEALDIPTIGIGAGPFCDGQVLVLHDMLGIQETNFRFVKKYAKIGEIARNAIINYSSDIRNTEFPGMTYIYKTKIKD